MGKIAVGTYTGTGAAISISLGWNPDYLRIWNVTDGDIAWEYFSGMTAANALQQIDVVDNATSAAHGMSAITSNGVTAYAGSATAAMGFTVGTSLSENAKVFRYIAMKEDDASAV